jgi:hypothetical protein
MDRPVEKKFLSQKGRLFVLSFLMLFTELALIRWTGSNVIYLSYFSNFVLLGSFLGIGIGFLRGRTQPYLFPWAIVLLAFFVGFVLGFPVTIQRASEEDMLFFGVGTQGLPVWVALPIVFLTVATIMASIAQGVARLFASFEPLEAYRLDILGSLAGIAAFSLLSFLWAPPVVWGAIAAIAFLSVCDRPVRLVQFAGAAALVAALGAESLVPQYSWSPYYKLAVFQFGPGVVAISANGIPHQVILPLEKYSVKNALYLLPYQARTSKRLDRVLVVGAGNGVDTAIALRHGARRVDSVEIDPRIYQIGQQLNPARPYQDPRVHIHIDDGRAFLQRDTNRYDLILFALPDSLTLVSGQSSLRLESYLFTIQALASARAHLASNGVFAMYNVYREPWLVDRLALTLRDVYGHPPCIVHQAEHAAVLTIGLQPTGTRCDHVWQPGEGPIPAPVTDDRPFLYLKSASIPTLYLISLALIALVSLLAIRASAGPFRLMRPYADLFFMGAAFLLLETKSVVGFALLFGSTWFVNALVFFGILLAVYAAIETARRFTVRKPALAYIALFSWLALAWAIEPSSLLGLATSLRLTAAVALAFGPIFLANLIFADRFRSSASSTIAFGTNLLGAMLGGILEYASLLIGYRDLLVVVAVLYALAFGIEALDARHRKRDSEWCADTSLSPQSP